MDDLDDLDDLDDVDAPAQRWTGEQLGSPVVEARRLAGGITATMLALTAESGERAVLRLMTNDPWRAHGAAMTTRERDTQLMLDGTDVAAPRSIALDAEGARTGVAAHLMTVLPGAVDEERCDDASLLALAETLARIHALRPAR